MPKQRKGLEDVLDEDEADLVRPEKTMLDILEELGIGADLKQEFSRQASYFAHWGFLHARAEDEARRSEERKDVIGAKLGSKYRSEKRNSKEAEIKEHITKHRKHREAVDSWHKAKFNRDILKIAVEAFKQRKDMLIQLGADNRTERDATDLSLKKKIKRANRVLENKVVKRASKRRRKGD